MEFAVYYVLVGVVGLLVAYEAVVKLVNHSKRYTASEDEARLNRIRILNQRGQCPTEVHYE